jgi:uncharacterized repeat protein (TIGR01451 family)
MQVLTTVVTQDLLNAGIDYSSNSVTHDLLNVGFDYSRSTGLT